MVNAQLDTLELELRKLDGVRAAGFSSQHDILYIQLFVEAGTSTATLPFQATRIAQRFSQSPVAVELIRWVPEQAEKPVSGGGLASIFSDTSILSEKHHQPTYNAGSITGSSHETENYTQEDLDTHSEGISEPQVYYEDDTTTNIKQEPSDFIDINIEESIETSDEQNELSDELIIKEDPQSYIDTDIQLPAQQLEERREDNFSERIVLLHVTTSSENDEIEVHLSYDDARTIGRAASNRGLLGAIDATVEAIGELTGKQDFHAEWARSLEPGSEHASLVAVGLTNSQETDSRHGIAGGSSPIEAAARATLNALNRTSLLTAAEKLPN